MVQVTHRLWFQKARKFYVCVECGRIIEKGEYYYRYRSYAPDKEKKKPVHLFKWSERLNKYYLYRWARYGLGNNFYRWAFARTRRGYWRSILRFYCNECGDQVFEREEVLGKRIKEEKREKEMTVPPRSLMINKLLSGILELDFLVPLSLDVLISYLLAFIILVSPMRVGPYGLFHTGFFGFPDPTVLHSLALKLVIPVVFIHPLLVSTPELMRIIIDSRAWIMEKWKEILYSTIKIVLLVSAITYAWLNPTIKTIYPLFNPRIPIEWGFVLSVLILILPAGLALGFSKEIIEYYQFKYKSRLTILCGLGTIACSLFSSSLATIFIFKHISKLEELVFTNAMSPIFLGFSTSVELNRRFGRLGRFLNNYCFRNGMRHNRVRTNTLSNSTCI